MVSIHTDYHVHSTFSPDGKNTIAELCQQALTLGMREIAITEHAEWHPRMHWPFPRADAYFDTIAQCRQRYGSQGLTIYSGVELGNPHDHQEKANALINQYPFDVVIASQHWLGADNIHLSEAFVGREPTQVYANYFLEMGRMSATCDFDFVAHFDRIFWPGTDLFGQPDLQLLEPVIRETLATIATNGQGLELNGRFLDHVPNWNHAILRILTWFREEHGEHVVVNSDAHHVMELARNQDVALALLRSTGFSAPARLRNLRIMSEQRLIRGIPPVMTAVGHALP